MLAQTLVEANREARKKRLRTAVVLAGVAGFVALFLGGVVRIDLSQIGFGDRETVALTPDPAAGTQAGENAPPPPISRTDAQSSIFAPPNSASNAPPDAQTLTGAGDTSTAGSSEETPAFSSLGQIDPKPNNPARRDAFKALLARFDADHRPEIDTEAFGQWNADAQAQILSEAADAVQTFSNGDYEGALTRLEAAVIQAEAELTARNAAFERALAEAERAADADDVALAELRIAEAVRLKPGDTSADRLSKRIDALPEILSAIDAAVARRLENDLDGEAQSLRRVLALDPSRLALGDRLAKIEDTLRESRFSSAISDGLAAIDRRDATAAESALAEAKRIFPRRDEVALLADRSAALKQERAFEALIAQGAEASARDDWPAALVYFEQAVQLFPDNKDAHDGVSLSSQLVGLQNSVAQHISAPHRLTADQVAASVDALLDQAAPYAALSPSLKEAAETLASLRQIYAKPVSITVLSDGVTHVSVRGVGIVGTALNRNATGTSLESRLHSSAYSSGIDFAHESTDRTWMFSGLFAGSRVSGSAEAAQRWWVR